MNADEIMLRVKTNWRLKFLLGLGLCVMFAAIYLIPQHYPVFPVTAMPLLRIDRMIPFLPAWVYIYESLYLIMPVAPWLMKTRGELMQYSKGIIFMNLVGFGFFFFIPTLVLRPTDVQDTNMLYRLLIQLDNPLNAFPSLHVAFALFHGACCHVVFSTSAKSRVLQGFFWLWAVGITASTLLTKQHVCVDALAGAVLGLGSFALFCRPKPLSELGRSSVCQKF
jgi:membrane-associated phospholipid phosphatase